MIVVLTACTKPAQITSTESQTSTAFTDLNRPKLVVGIVVDQMRYDYLYRYWDKYSDNGFKRMLRKGFNFKNTQYSYVPTYTAPGHASIYTGSEPAINGIVGNSWYDRTTGKVVYCTEDKSVKTVGSTSNAGEMSPANMVTTTITDELRLATNMGSKVIGVSLKDRGSILPAGHLGNGAYWFDSESGNWITSTFYRKDLPAWVQQFNQQQYPNQYLSQVWNTLLPIEQYIESTADDMPWEGTLSGESKPVFPHNLPAIRKKDFELLRSTPGGNTITKDFALAALKGENLGKDKHTDFLTVSFSTPDYVGHTFGPNSIEAQDIFIRLDREIGEMIDEIEAEVGAGNVLFFLTSDHGAAHVPAYLTEYKVPAGVSTSAVIRDSVDNFLSKLYGKGAWVERYMNQNIYLNRKLVDSKKLSLGEVQQRVAEYVIRLSPVERAVTGSSLATSSWSHGPLARVERGYYPSRSGDVVLILSPAWFEGYGSGRPTGTTHGSYSNYDTHVPLVWYGWNVKPGESSVETKVADIAPTIASWLYIQEPNGSVGQPLQQYMK
ncbi:alkaline phosphatase family protein [Pontibacter aydingkolensis]|uniref:Alkaline phosphatase family protein n=2 Tax=Pontibacter aydingkolensis TaxID=1911536 RepID=A0ABS7CT45_9BACT|nr:alkaline phosphatase family protein [Pontibacter aydingkolensis]